jgi:hypothetical protein
VVLYPAGHTQTQLSKETHDLVITPDHMDDRMKRLCFIFLRGHGGLCLEIQEVTLFTISGTEVLLGRDWSPLFFSRLLRIYAMPEH